MPTPEAVEVGKRMREARLRAAIAQGGTVSQARMAELITAVIGRPIGQGTWSDYELAVTEPPFDVVRAAARLSGLRPSYIAFGDDPSIGVAEMPDPTKDYKLTPEDEEQVLRQAAAEAERNRGKRA